MDEVVGRNRLDPDPVDSRFLPVFQHDAVLNLSDAQGGHDHFRLGLADFFDRFRIEVVSMLVGRQDQIRLRKFREIPILADRVVVDHLSAELEHQR